MCVWWGGCRRRKMVVIMTYGLESSSYWAERTQEWLHRGMLGFFLSFLPVVRVEAVRTEGWGEDWNQRKTRKWISVNHQQWRQTPGERRDSCQNAWRSSCVYTFHFVSQCLLHSLYLWHSSQALRDSLRSEVLRTCLCGRRREGLRITSKSCLIIPATAAADSLWVRFKDGDSGGGK